MPTRPLSSQFLFALITLTCLQADEGKILHDASSPIRKPGPEFGAELKTAALKVGATMDVAVAGEHVLAIGQGELRVLTTAPDGKPALVGKLRGLGNTRQIAVARGHAFITAREDGLFIVDVSEPAAPKLVHHYDTAELATAIAVSGDVAAVGNRFAGIELLDVSTPSEPRHLSIIRVGEVQSLVFHSTWLYAGTWSEKAVAVIDVSNPWKPSLVTTVSLDGRGDGLDVSGNLLAAATGHHARRKGSPKPGDAAFGHGHGVEFFDISNPSEPRHLSGVKFPPFYRLGMDMWGVVLAGGHAFVNDTHNGLFLIDVRDPAKPRNIGWSQLPAVKGDPSPVVGLAATRGRVFLAGGFDDLHLVDTGLADAAPALQEKGLQVPAKPRDAPAHGLPAYVVNGSIHAVVPWKDDLLLVAAGSAGWHIVRQTENGFEGIAQHPTRGFARDVAFHGDGVFVAESLGGLSIWQKQSSGEMNRLSAYEVPGKSITQVVIADEGRIAFLAVGANTLHVIHIGPDGKTERLLEETPRSGLFYRDPFSPLAPDGKHILVQWHTTGLHEFVIENGTVKRTGWAFPHAMDTECGATPWNDGWLATSRRGFFLLARDEKRSPETIGLRRFNGQALPGKPSTDGKTLFIADPFLGEVTALDLTDDKAPRLIAQLRLSGHPGRVKMHRGQALVPAGRDGLLMWRVAASIQPRAEHAARDPWLWPFAPESIWNMPIGSGTVYKPAHLGPAGHVGVDTQFLLKTRASDPERDVLESPAFKQRIGTTPLNFRLRVPDDWIVPDIGKNNPYGLTPNANYAILLPDGANVMQGSRICRPQAGGPIYLPAYMNHPANRQAVSLTGDGLSRIGQGASKMSTLGGTIRLGELVGDQPIRHVIKINPFAARYCYYSEQTPGWRWPARAADAYAAQEYKGTNPAVVMGSLLALKPDATPEQLGIRTAPGRKLFHALQDYGAYFTEDAHWDTWDLIVERDAEKEFERAHGFSMKSPTWLAEINRLVVALYVVDNNSPANIGGGGQPRQPLAPSFRK